MRIAPFAASLLAASVLLPTAALAQAPGAVGAGVHAHRHVRQDGPARRLPRQVRRARVDQPRVPVRAQALHERQHAGPAEGSGARATSSGCRSTRRTPAHSEFKTPAQMARWLEGAGCGAEGRADRRRQRDGPRLRGAHDAAHVRHRPLRARSSTTARSTTGARRIRPMRRPRSNYVRAALTEAMDGRPVTVAIDVAVRLQHQVQRWLVNRGRGQRASSARRIRSAVAGWLPR